MLIVVLLLLHVFLYLRCPTHCKTINLQNTVLENARNPSEAVIRDMYIMIDIIIYNHIYIYTYLYIYIYSCSWYSHAFPYFTPHQGAPLVLPWPGSTGSCTGSHSFRRAKSPRDSQIRPGHDAVGALEVWKWNVSPLEFPFLSGKLGPKLLNHELWE